MKSFFRVPRNRPFLCLTTVCVVTLTGLVVAKATPEAAEYSELKSLAEEADTVSNVSETEFLDTFGGLSEENLSKALESSKKAFVFTSAGGLQAENPFCERFIDEQGNYGVYGKIVSDYLKKKLKANRTTPILSDDLIGMESRPHICPNWRAFDDAERIKFWTWTFAAMSSAESSCGADKRALKGVQGVAEKNSNGKIIRYKTAIGLLQMEKALGDRSWRKLPTCNVADSEIGNSFNNLRCGIDIMEVLVSPNPPDKNPWPIYPGPGMEPKSYWFRLREPNGGVIGELMRSYKPCRERHYSAPKVRAKSKRL